MGVIMTYYHAAAARRRRKRKNLENGLEALRTQEAIDHPKAPSTLLEETPRCDNGSRIPDREE